MNRFKLNDRNYYVRRCNELESQLSILREALEQNNFALQCMIIHFNGKVPGLTDEQVFYGAVAARDSSKDALKKCFPDQSQKKE